MEKTTKEYKEFVLEQLSNLENIVCKPMMGEYLLYQNGILFGGIYNNRVLIKRTEGNKIFNLPEQIPYEGAKPMYFIKDIEDREMTKEIILKTCEDLPQKKGLSGN